MIGIYLLRATWLLGLFSLSFFIGTTSYAAAPTGKIKFETRRVDFGKVDRGVVLSKKFQFTNKGKGPLRIKGVYAACGCTVVDFAMDRIYAPGEKGEISIQFKTENFVGKIHKVVTVMTNESGRPDRLLNLKVNLQEEFSISPPLIDFGNAVADHEVSKVVTLKSIGKFRLKIEGSEFDQDKFLLNYSNEIRVSKNKKEIIPGNWVVRLTLKKGQQSGFLKESIRLLTNSKSMPKVNIPVRANIKGNFSYSPNYLEFGSIASKSKIKRQIQLKSIRQMKLANVVSTMHINGNPIKDPTSYIKVDMPEFVDANKEKLISITLNNQAGYEGSVHGAVKLITDDPLQKEIQVHFFAFFR